MSDDSVSPADNGNPRGAAPPDAALADVPFQALLARLGQEGERAEAVYEGLRRRLITYLRLHVPVEADELADLALDRMARRIHGGTGVQNVYLYALGIARLLVYEARTRFAREQTKLDEVRLEHQESDEAAADAADTEAVHAALTSCLEQIGEPGAELILAYYADEGRARIEKRLQMATRLGLSPNALRNRALRLRDALERCVRGKLGWRDELGHSDTSDESNEASRR